MAFQPNTTSFNDAKCILVIGATSGIGLDLALRLHEMPSKPAVIVTGRRQGRLDSILEKGSGAGKDKLHAVPFDVTAEPGKLKSDVEGIIAKFPELDAVVFNAGVQHMVDFTKPIDEAKLSDLAAENNTNYLSIVRMIVYFLPHFLARSEKSLPSFILTVTSGLAFAPLAPVPNYSATKAALHSLSITLRTQLRETKIKVAEIAPPLVESELHDAQGTTPQLAKMWMPLSEFTPQVLTGLAKGDEDIAIGNAAEWFQKHETGKQQNCDAFAAMMKKQYAGK